MILLREATEADLSYIINLHENTIGSAWSRCDYLEAIEAANKRLYVVLVESELGGYVLLSVLAPETDIINISIDSGKQSKGIGRRVLELVKEILYSEKVTEMFLEVRQNSRAVNFMKKTDLK